MKAILVLLALSAVGIALWLVCKDAEQFHNVLAAAFGVAFIIWLISPHHKK